MTSVNSISSVNVCTDCVSIALVSAEDFGFMGGCVGPQNSVFVKIVSIGSAPTRVVRWEAKRIEILSDGDDGREIVVVAVGRRGKACLDQPARQSYRVRGLEMQAALEGGDNRRRNIGPIVCRIEFPIYDDGWRD